MSSLVFKASFCSGVASKLTMIWGDFAKRLARFFSGRLVSDMILVMTRLVKMPSPVGSFGKMM